MGPRALVSTVDGLRVLSRRGWDLTAFLPELERLPPGLVLDGELVGWEPDGLPSFPAISARMLHGRRGVAGRCSSSICSPSTGRDQGGEPTLLALPT